VSGSIAADTSRLAAIPVFADAPTKLEAPTALLVIGFILGLILIVGLLVVAIRLLRQPTHRYQGDPTPQEGRSFRETMVVWLTGPRS
jgi:hypothetical protein